MKTTINRTILGVMTLSVITIALLLPPLVTLHAAEPNKANDDKAKVPAQVEPKIADALKPVTLRQAELSGEIGKRLDDLIYRNYMVLNLDRDFIEPFRSRPFTNEWHYVGVGKVIDAGSLFAAYTGDPKVNERTSRLIEDLMKTRDADGYLGHIKAQPEGRQNYLNWTLHEQEYSVLGLVHNGLTSGSAKSLQYAREMADYILATFPNNPTPEKVCTAGLPEAMLVLYGCTGDKRYLRFAADTRHGNATAEIKCASLNDWQQTFETKPAHVYVMTARCYAQTELFRYEPAPQLLNMSRYMRHELLREDGGGLTVIGSASDGEQFSYTQNGKGAISESCVTAYLIRWLDSLMRLEGDLRYGDIIERTVYNALFAAQDPAGRRLRYFTPFTGPRDYYGNDGFCCPGNYRRIVAELPQKVYYRCGDGGIAVNLFTPSKKVIVLEKDRSVTIEQQTDYPSSGHVTIHVSPTQPTEFALRLRIPRWCPKATVQINSETPVAVSPGAQPCQLRRMWKSSDVVTLDMPMPWRLIRGRKVQEGKVALMRGPVVYCIGSAQNAELVKKYPDPSELTINLDTIGEVVSDTSIRPDGRKVTLQALPPGANADPVTVVMTEFVDPSGVATYFRIPNLTKSVDDELMSDCFAK
jgi:DUF1680 family protein